MKRDEPSLFLRALAVLDAPFRLALLGLGVFYVVTGNAGGEVIGAVLIVASTWRLSLVLRAIAGR